MTTEKLFEMATRSKLRFPSTKGELSVEDLWDLFDKDLDVVYKNLKDQEVKSSEESLLDDANVDPKLTAAIGIVKYIFTTKRNERLAENERINKKLTQRKYIDALSKKQDEAIEKMSEAELRAMIDSLED
ncbi:hypothetical protein [Anaerostipes sp. Marseille-Q3525]|uniref:hypothetical protein n=1 Tax=Anaerostipes sp. Marseille-Q3525 TaxID=2758418 RepID=UPI001BAD0846|nr:hypothetical protein [Anaerostipes sp. Marseille-Q3525]MBR9961865.1 hypothetical protein [Anaerostipes sp. Marseille-Q3525]